MLNTFDDQWPPQTKINRQDGLLSPEALGGRCGAGEEVSETRIWRVSPESRWQEYSAERR
jgi:hypothetical protein